MISRIQIWCEAARLTPAPMARRVAWRNIVGTDPPRKMMRLWLRTHDRDFSDCRALIADGWDDYRIKRAFARQTTLQAEGYLNVTLREAADDLVNSQADAFGTRPPSRGLSPE